MNPDLFHITHINNLASIVQHNGLWSDADRIRGQLANQNIGYSHIKQRRLAHQVRVSRQGVIGDYVPFNFCSRSVMLYVVANGHENYRGGQSDILHLVTDVNAVRRVNANCFFTDIHADLGYSEQIDDFSRLNELNWGAISQKYWSTVKEEKQAEFLAHQFVPWTSIKEIGVMNEQVAQRVNQILTLAHHRPSVNVHTNWYY
jgi:ssDNA thymidine ADP-ribosyltransferase, DarT